jgi:galactokinase
VTVLDLYAGEFGAAAATSAAASGRVNLLGEHTDYNDGFVLPTTVPFLTEVAIGRSPDDRFRFVSASLQGEAARVDYVDGSEPGPGYGRYVYGCIAVLREEEGADIPPCCLAIRSNLPIGAGLSSSAALEVSVLRALRQHCGLRFGDTLLARYAQRAEIEYAGVRCGILDQMAVSVGQPGQMLFLDTRSLQSRLVPLPPGGELAIFDSGVPRSLAASAYNERRRECEAAAAALGVTSLRDVPDPARVESLPSPLRERARHVLGENARVLEAVRGVPAQRFGELMLESHRSLRDDYAVSIAALDTLVESVMAQPGAYGCKLTGAGFGGACVALVASGSGSALRSAALRAYAGRGYSGRVLL